MGTARPKHAIFILNTLFLSPPTTNTVWVEPLLVRRDHTFLTVERELEPAHSHASWDILFHYMPKKMCVYVVIRDLSVCIHTYLDFMVSEEQNKAGS